MTEERKERLDKLVANATEAEPEPRRHEMEEAVLATVAQMTGLGNKNVWVGFHSLDWSRKDYAAIAKAIWRERAFSECFQNGRAADTVLVQQSLKKAGQSVSDAVLTGILDGSKAKDILVALRYIGIMNKQDRFRRAEEAGREYLAAVEKARKDGGDVDAAIAGLLKDAFSLVYGKKLGREHRNEAEDAEGFMDELNARRTDGRRWGGLDCGFNHLNEVLDGLGPGLFVLAGPPSCGKTTLAKQIADAVAVTEKVRVLFWSFEQSKEELRIKSLARLASVDTRAIRKGRITDEDGWAKVKKANEDYRRGPGPWLTIVEAEREDTLDRIRDAAVMAKYRAVDKPILLVLDYLQIIPAGKDAPSEIRERVDWHLSELRRLARDLKSPVLVISSENREAYKSRAKKPTLAALKESGGIEYSADAVLCLWRDKKESQSLTEKFGRKTIRVEVHVLKERNGELANIKTDFTPAWALFTEAGKDDLDWDAALGE